MFRKQLTLTLALILGILSANQVLAFADLRTLTGNSSVKESAITTLDEFKTILESVPKEKFREINERVFAFEIKTSGFALPTIAVRSPNGSFIWNTFRLAPVPADTPAEVLADRMMKLLAASGELGDFFFSYDAESRMITLHGCIQVHGKITTEFYLDHLSAMGTVVEKTEHLWNPEKWAADEPKHIGTWEAESNGMTLKLQNADRFELIVGETVTKGSFKLDGNQLTMEDSTGDTLTGEIKFDNPNQFQLNVEGNVNVFVRL